MVQAITRLIIFSSSLCSAWNYRVASLHRDDWLRSLALVGPCAPPEWAVTRDGLPNPTVLEPEPSWPKLCGEHKLNEPLLLEPDHTYALVVSLTYSLK